MLFAVTLFANDDEIALGPGQRGRGFYYELNKGVNIMSENKTKPVENIKNQAPPPEDLKKDELSPENLDNISGGAYPTAINGQITDSVVQD